MPMCLSKGTHQDKTDDNVFVTITHINFQECLIECLFRENSTATACVTVYWKYATTPYQLINFSSLKLEAQGGKARGSIDTGDGLYHVAVFAFSDNMIRGKPVAKFHTGHETGIKSLILTSNNNIIIIYEYYCFCLSGSSGWQDVTVTTVVAIVSTTIAILALAITGEC